MGRPAEHPAAGDVFGRLTVEDAAWRPGGARNRQRHFLCRCRCGGLVTAKRQELTDGQTRSCGCLKRDLAIAQGLKAAEHTRQQLAKLAPSPERDAAAAAYDELFAPKLHELLAALEREVA